MDTGITFIDVITVAALFLFMGIVITMSIVFYKKFSPLVSNIAGPPIEELTLRELNSFDASIEDILNKLQIDLSIADVFIGRFHNGGNFANGVKMKKFSIVYEKCDWKQKELVKWRFHDKFTSQWIGVFDKLYATGEFYCPEVEQTDYNDFKRDMQRYEFKSVYIYLICQPNAAKTPEGFLAVGYRDVHLLPAAIMAKERDRIRNDILDLLSLMNLTAPHIIRK